MIVSPIGEKIEWKWALMIDFVINSLNGKMSQGLIFRVYNKVQGL